MNPETFEVITRADTFDVRDVIARFEELETALQDAHAEDTAGLEFDGWLASVILTSIERAPEHEMLVEAVEFQQITEFLESVAGYGGDEQWRGDWYPVTFIAHSYFTEYAEELANDVCDMKNSTNWPFNCIDWDKAARELAYDYSIATVGESDFYYR